MTDAPVSLLGLTNADAEIAVLHAMRIDTNAAIDLTQTLTPQDFYDTRRQVVFEAIRNLLMGVEPIDTSGIHAECTGILRERKLKIAIEKEYIESLVGGDIRRYAMYANTVRKLSWLRLAGDFAFWLVQELQERPQPDELFTAAQERWQVLAPQKTDSRFVYGWDTVREHRDIIRQRVQDRESGEVVRFDWPWASWNNGKVRPLQPGFVGILAAPDGLGKTTYLEQIAEYWASQRIHVVYVHLEDNRQYKYDRRLARHGCISIDSIQDGKFTAQEIAQANDAHTRIEEWAGYLHYYDAAGENMTSIVRELESRVAEGVCQAVVFDYLDKVQPSRGQSQLYAGNTWERQANDMEQLKTFAEKSKLPVFTATQGNKSMQSTGTQTRQAIQGSGQKSQKAQLVLILTRDLVGDEGLRDKNGKVLAEPGEYSPIAKIRIDKQNTGKTGELQQFILGQYFTVRDIQIERKELM
jgi:replicative DNA helicase